MRLVIQLDNSRNLGWKGKALEGLDVNWAIVVQGLAKEIGAGIELSHGRDNVFAEEFRWMGMAIGAGEEWRMQGFPEVLMEELQVEWAKLRKIANGL